MSAKNNILLITGKPAVRHYLFYKFLLISPSYKLAFRRIFLNESIPESEIPEEFDFVLEICRRAGNIYELSFDDWWDRYGIKLLSTEKKQTFLPYKIDLRLSKKEILLNLEQYLEKLEAPPYVPEKIQISFLKNQLRPSTLEAIWSKVDLRATSLKWDALYGFPKTPYWKMEVMYRDELDLTNDSDSPIDISNDAKKFKRKKKRIAYLTMLWSKHLKEALYISENAARGRFPSKDIIRDCPKFDFIDIEKIITENIILSRESEQIRSERGLNIYNHEHSRDSMKTYKREKLKKGQTKKVEILAEKKARLKLNDPDYE